MKVRPAQYPNTDSFAHGSMLSGSGRSSFIDERRMGDSAYLLNHQASQRLKELNAYELPVGEDAQDAEIFRSEIPDVDFDMKNQ